MRDSMDDIYGLSPVQEGILFHALQAPDSGMYITQLCVGVQGELQSEAFEHAWEAVVDRHAVLRTAFFTEDIDQPVQVVFRQATILWTHDDWRHLSAEARRQRLQTFLKEDRQRGFRLQQAPLMRLACMRETESTWRIVWTSHHLLLDGWSVGLVLQDVLAHYQALTQHRPLSHHPVRPYKDYILWLQHQDRAEMAPFWRTYLDGIEAPTTMRIATPAAPPAEADVGELELHLSTQETDQLQAFVRRRRLTLSTLIQGAWALVLSRYSGDTDVLFGVTYAGRPAQLPGADRMVGLFINTLPLRVLLPAHITVEDWLDELQQQQGDLQRFQHSPLVDVQGWSAIPRGQPLFESLVVIENYPVDTALSDAAVSLRLHDIRSVERTNYPLVLTVLPDRQLTLRLDYQRQHYCDDTMYGLLQHLRNALCQLPTQGQRRLPDVSVLTPAERQRLLVTWNATAVTYAPDRCLHHGFEQQVQRTPDAIAVSDATRHLSYRDLNRRANQVAHHLCTLGIEPDDIVALCMERSLEMVVGLLGILKAGGAYMPLDPTYPPDHLTFMLNEAQVSVVVTQRNVVARLPAHRAHVLDPDTDWPVLAQASEGNPRPLVHPAHRAYVIYTSGSTGRPKGVMTTHRSIDNRLRWMQDVYALTDSDRVLQKTPFGFDASVWEFFWPLSTGARLVMAPPGSQQDSAELVRLITEQHVTILHVVPSMLQVILDEPGIDACHSLRQVISSGEALSFELQQRFFARLDASLDSLYGPTEAAVDVSFWACQRDSDERTVPIGRPIANTQLYILDSHLHPVPPGVAGELYIGGLELARGYLHRPALTAERFIPHPFGAEPGVRLYQTGDLTRYRPDGNIEFVGRLDDQVKLRGYRIELGEIDRQSLPDPTRPTPAADDITLRTEVEELLAGIWARVLDLERVGIDEPFFELGGHSLLATRLLAQVRSVFHQEIPLQDLYGNLTIRQLGQYLEQRRATGIVPQQVELHRADRSIPLELSFAQQRLWLLQHLDPESAFYHVAAAFRLQGKLDCDALARAAQALVRRHEILRTTFRDERGRPVQVVSREWPTPLRVVDLRHPERPVNENVWRQALTECVQQPFNLVTGPLLRMTVWRLSDQESIFAVTLHHIISDGWSLGILSEELAALYAADIGGTEASLPPLPWHYADFAHWQHTQLHRERVEQLAYWQERLAGELPVLLLPADRPRPDEATHQGAHLTKQLATSLFVRLEAMCREHRVTPFMLLLAVFKVLLYRYTGTTDILVGTPVANRYRAEFEPLIGFFLNTLVLRTDLAGNPTFAELLLRLREVTLAAYANQDIPFEQVVEAVQPERSSSRSPLFQVMFVLQNFPQLLPRLEGLSATPIPVENAAAQFDLLLSVSLDGGDVHLNVEYRTALFEASTIERVLGHYETLLTHALDYPRERIGTLSLLNASERRHLLALSAPSQGVEPEVACYHRLFSAQASRTPDAIAAVYEDANLSYGALERRANQLAHWLQEQSIGPERFVGICMERSLAMIVAVLGILKSGGAYMPIDPQLPAERIRFMLDDTGTTIILTQAHLASLLPSTVRTLSLDRDGATIAAYRQDEPVSLVQPHHLIYAIYTSGTTGTPKAVMIEHRSTINLLYAMCERVYPGPERPRLRATLQAPLWFDASMQQLVLLLCGSTLEIIPEAMRTDPEAFVAYVATRGIEVLDCTPSLLQLLVSAGLLQQTPPRPKIVQVAGEAVGSDLWANMASAHGTACFNIYGPTEATVNATGGRVAADTPHIGTPLAHYAIYLLDAHLQPVPVGVPGDIYIGGPGVARGYVNRPGLTAETFIPSPSALGTPPARLYKTGDLARWRPDGKLDFLGRIDHQVKIRGFRIELGEIDAALKTHPAVRHGVTVIWEDRPGNPRLVAYLVLHPGHTATDDIWRSFLQSRLPAYMVPSFFVLLPRLPLTPSGKVDRRSLPIPTTPGAGEGEATSVAPRTHTEMALVTLWSEVLGIDRCGVHDDFFALGGHSLLVAQLITRMRDRFHLDLPLRLLFEVRTIADIAEHIESITSSPSSVTLPPLHPVPRGHTMPLSFVQERLWFLDRLEATGSAYYLPLAFNVYGPFDIPAFYRALQEILRRHEVLRTQFVLYDGRPVLHIQPDATPFLWCVEATEIAATEPQAALQEVIQRELQRPFRLDRDPLLRTLILPVGPERHVVLFIIHHMVCDAWSVGVLWRELEPLYGAFAADKLLPALPDLPVQYADYAAWQRTQLTPDFLQSDYQYWQRQLDGAQPLPLPIDHPRPAMQTFQGAHLVRHLPTSLSTRLNALGDAEGSTMFMVTLAVLNALLYRYSGQEDIVVGSPFAHRPFRQLENLLGPFLNTLVLRTQWDGSITFRQLLQCTRDRVLEALAHQHLPFERVVEELNPQRDLSRNPLFQVFFTLQNMAAGPETFAGLTWEVLDVELETVQFDVMVSVLDHPAHLQVAWAYNTDVFEPVTARQMLDHFCVLMEQAVDDPDRHLEAMAMVSPHERDHLLYAWNATEAAYPHERCVHELVEAQVARTPDAVAISDADQQLTYGVLDERANRLAARLRRHGAGPDVRVGIDLERSVHTVVVMLAILKAGAAYVPLDSELPMERVKAMLTDARLALIVTQPHRVAARDALWQDMAVLQRQEVPESEVVLLQLLPTQKERGTTQMAMPDNLAYVMYTSGSTGHPKGVAIPHRAVVNFLHAMRQRPGLRAADRLLATTTISFDISVLECLLPLTTGASVYMATRAEAVDGSGLSALLETRAITVMQATPTAWQLLHESGWQGKADLRMWCGGEALPSVLAGALLARGAALWNLYGPTESTIWSTAARMNSAAAPIPLGTPIANTQLYLLDSQLQPVPTGVAGMLYIGGMGLARGYLHQAARTAAAFIPDPFGSQPGARLYTTGDLVRRRADGRLEFLGRNDPQAKVRGYRIELTEIEAHLAQHVAVRQVAAVVHGDESNRSITAYIVPEAGHQPDDRDWRRFLQSTLPAYMIPARFVMLRALPQTSNGKIDRRALAHVVPTMPAVARPRLAPRDALERQLADIWQEILVVHDVGVTDTFFELGGHSLLAVRLLTRIEAAYGLTLPLASLFTHATIAEQADLIRARGILTSAHPLLVPMQTQGQRQPIFCVHPAGGNVLTYMPLVRRLGTEQPFYGLQALGVAEACPPHASIEEMAKDYLAAIRTVAPAGPAILAGHSFGGLVAYDMARQLADAGQRPPLVLILDVPAPLSRYRSLLTSPTVRDEPHMLSEMSAMLSHMLGQDIFIPPEAFRGHSRQSHLALLAQRLQAANVLPDTTGTELISRLATVLMANLNAQERYVPGPYTGKITLVRAADPLPVALGRHPAFPERDLGWRALTSGPVEVLEVPGDHITMVTEPYVQALADVITRMCTVAVG